MSGSTIRLGALASGALALCCASTIAGAAETAHFMNAPAAAGIPQPKLAVQVELKLQLPQGRGLARLLLDAGVDRDDAAAAARLAAGHLGDGAGGCAIIVSISRSVGAGPYRLERVSLSTMADQTVIERRQGELAVASTTNKARRLRLV